MTNKEAVEFATLAIHVARLQTCNELGAYRIARVLAMLQRLGNEAHTHAENVCNYPMPEGKDERKRASIHERAAKALLEIGITSTSADRAAPNQAVIEVHGDPRGSCLQINIACDNLSLRF